MSSSAATRSWLGVWRSARRCCAVSQLRLSPPLADSSDLQKLYDAENAIAWKIARELDPKFSVAEGTFLAASAGVPLSSFETTSVASMHRRRPSGSGV